MCVALYRALQYEKGDRKWGEGFKSSIMDMGIQLYDMHPSRDPSTGARTRCFNGKCGVYSFGKIAQIALYSVAPIIPILQIVENTNKFKKRPAASTTIPKVGGMVMMIFFVTWFLFQFLDHLPLSGNLQEWGSVIGNPTSLDGNVRYYLSNRWGYYHQWANKDDQRDAGSTITWNRQVNLKGQEKPLTATINFESEAVGVGERFAFNYRIAVIGWFFMFMFIVYLVSLRSEIRVICGINGTLIEDFLVCLFWSMALWQMLDTIKDGPKKDVSSGSDTI
jgi:hypothetical protein